MKFNRCTNTLTSLQLSYSKSQSCSSSCAPKKSQQRQQTDEYGTEIQHDMTKGSYKIRLVPGPSWEGQKQENLESLKMVLQANPELFNMIADLYVENLPLANSNELRNRLRTIVPPEVIEAGKTGQPIPPKPPQPDPMIMMKMQELALKKQQLEMEQQKLQTDAQLSQGELQIKMEELETKKMVAATQLQEMELRFMSERERTESNEQIAHADNLIKLLTHGATLDHKSQEAKHERHTRINTGSNPAKR